MCGVQASPPNLLALKIVDELDGRDDRLPIDRFGNVPARYNGAPSQELGHPPPAGYWRAHPRSAPLGANSKLVQ